MFFLTKWGGREHTHTHTHAPICCVKSAFVACLRCLISISCHILKDFCHADSKVHMLHPITERQSSFYPSLCAPSPCLLWLLWHRYCHRQPTLKIAFNVLNCFFLCVCLVPEFVCVCVCVSLSCVSMYACVCVCLMCAACSFDVPCLDSTPASSFCHGHGTCYPSWTCSSSLYSIADSCCFCLSSSSSSPFSQEALFQFPPFRFSYSPNTSRHAIIVWRVSVNESLSIKFAHFKRAIKFDFIALQQQQQEELYRTPLHLPTLKLYLNAKFWPKLTRNEPETNPKRTLPTDTAGH